MATGGPIRELCEEVTCPICLDYFKCPMTIAECGHNFCQDCLFRSWKEVKATKSSCPVCKIKAQPKNLRLNRQLVNIVEITKKLSPQEGEAREEEVKESLCEKHREPLKLFCQTDETVICTVCDKSEEHKNHVVIPAEEASKKYKTKISNCLVPLKTEMGKILVCLADAEVKSRATLQQTGSERKKRMAEFKTLHQLLNEQEKALLAEIDETEKETARKRGKDLSRFSAELLSFESLIQEIKEKRQQPASELLKDIKSALQRYKKKFKNPDDSLSNLERIVIWNNKKANPKDLPCSVTNRLPYCLYNCFLESAMKQLRDILYWASPKLRATVYLDTASASFGFVPCLDQSVITEEDQSEDLEKGYRFMLGHKGFTAGCHYWDVLVRIEEGWAVGVARKCVRSKVTFTPEEGIWAFGQCKGQYKAFIKGTDTTLILKGELKKIRVCLNYDSGKVAFFDTNQATLLYEFSGASFSGDALMPFFAMYNHGSFWLNP